MNNQRIMNVLLAPHMSEKGALVGDKNHQYIFRVAPSATKPEIKKAVEFLFKAEVTSVQVLNMQGKVKRFRQKIGHRKSWKKAYVSLKAGQDINFTAPE
jgi:large subunit ribosomal protein L23